MKSYWIYPLFLLMLLILPPTAAAQTSGEVLEAGRDAFREGRYADAAAAFERAVKQNPDDAEAHFLLARVYAETPLADRKKAEKALDRALELDPDNLRYLVGRLHQLRVDSWNFFAERVREQKRIELARHILALDSTNAFAHEELGASAIRDFWRYRNAIMLPTLTFARPSISADISEQDLATQTLSQQQDLFLDPTGENEEVDNLANFQTGNSLPSFNPNDVFLADRFDLETLKEMGVPVLDLSRRAQRAYDEAIHHLQQALQTDPRRRSVYDHLMEIYALKGEYEAAQEMLQEMYTFFPEDVRTWLYLGFAHYRMGAMDAANKSFETAFQYMDEEARHAFSGLDEILPEEEKARYQEDEVAYASRFWTSKDPRYLTPYNERKLEHYARLVYADLLYGSEDLGLRGWNTQRGHILVRYGLPQTDVVLVPKNTAQTADQVLNARRAAAVGSDPAADNATAASPIGWQRRVLAREGSGFDMAAEANTFNIWDYGDFRFVFEDPFRNGEYRLYSPSAAEVSTGVNPWLNDYALRAEETFKEVPERYEYEAPGRQIDMPYLVNVFKGEDGQADLYVHYGIPITEQVQGQEMINLTANVGAFLVSDTRDILVERRRTIYGLRTSQVMPFKETNLWVDTQAMQAPPGAHEVSMEFETASGSTVAVQRRTVDVPDFTQGRLAVSDMMLAYHVEEAPEGKPLGGADVVRRGLSITPAPWSVFAVDHPIYLYFEIYDLARQADGQTDYTMEALLVPKEEAKGITKLFKGLLGGEKGVSVQLPGSGTAADEGQYLILDAANQEPGLYTLILRVRDNVSGRSVEEKKDLFLE